MAQHRTRKDKEKAQKIRLKDIEKDGTTASFSNTYSFSSQESANSEDRSNTLLKIDSKYIVKDLFKTVTISSLLLMVVIGIYFYLRYN